MQTQPGSGDAGGIDVAQFHAVFFEEADEHLVSMEALLLEIDVAAPDEEAVNAVFRAAHSIKGGAGMFGFTDVTDLTHEAETLLDRVRKGQLPLSVEIVNAMLETGDALKAQLAVRRGEDGAAPDVSALLRRLRALAAGHAVAPAVASAAAAPASSAAAADGYGFFDAAPTHLAADGYGFFEAAAAEPASEGYGFFDAAPGAAAAPETAGAPEGFGFFAPHDQTYGRTAPAATESDRTRPPSGTPTTAAPARRRSGTAPTPTPAT